MPLLATQADQLVALAEQAPYGRGPETLVDTEVRRTWQLDAARVHIGGRRWSEDLAGVVERVRTGLGVAGEVQAELYKLLVYDTGSFFVAHRDMEKAPGMFATLVVVLPCDYSGGELLIRHKGEEVRIDLHRDEPSEAAFAAFYADCRHEILPIASGHRLALVYNLVRVGSGPLPMAPDYVSEQARVADLLRAWAKSDQGPTKLVYPQEHAYSEAELGFETLKGADAAMTRVVIGTARDAAGANTDDPLRREARVACNCTHCRDLSRFLAAPAEPVWRLKAAQRERDHVTHSVRQHRCDLDLATDARGRPYTLVCTKNQANFERRVKQRGQDLDYLGRLAD